MIDQEIDGPGARRSEPDLLVREVEAVLGRRVDDLERDNRQLQRQAKLLTVGFAATLTLAVGALIYGLTAESRVSGVVRAHQFVLQDVDGNHRGGISLTPEGGSRVVLKDRAGRERMRLTLLADGSPGLSFADAEGRSRVVMGFLPDETANLVFADRLGRTRAVFGLMPDESSTLVFADNNGETRIGLGIDPRGGAGLTVFERDNPGASVPVPAQGDTLDAGGADLPREPGAR
jgi:hypothetical protein